MPKLSLLPSAASFRENLRMAFTALTLNPFRTFLTMLGMIVGVAAVIAVTALGNGMAESTKARLASLGSNLVSVRPAIPTRAAWAAPRASSCRTWRGSSSWRFGRVGCQGGPHRAGRGPSELWGQ